MTFERVKKAQENITPALLRIPQVHSIGITKDPLTGDENAYCLIVHVSEDVHIPCETEGVPIIKVISPPSIPHLPDQ